MRKSILYFQGCIRDLDIQRKNIKFSGADIFDRKSLRHIIPCSEHPCSKKPCKNGGFCSLRKGDGLRKVCKCQGVWRGSRCHRKTKVKKRKRNRKRHKGQKRRRKLFKSINSLKSELVHKQQRLKNSLFMQRH